MSRENQRRRTPLPVRGRLRGDRLQDTTCWPTSSTGTATTTGSTPPGWSGSRSNGPTPPSRSTRRIGPRIQPTGSPSSSRVPIAWPRPCYSRPRRAATRQSSPWSSSVSSSPGAWVSRSCTCWSAGTDGTATRPVVPRRRTGLADHRADRPLADADERHDPLYGRSIGGREREQVARVRCGALCDLRRRHADRRPGRPRLPLAPGRGRRTRRSCWRSRVHTCRQSSRSATRPRGRSSRRRRDRRTPGDVPATTPVRQRGGPPRGSGFPRPFSPRFRVWRPPNRHPEL